MCEPIELRTAVPGILLRASRDARQSVFFSCMQAETGISLSITSTHANTIFRGTNNTVMAGTMLYLLEAGETERLLSWVGQPATQGAQA